MPDLASTTLDSFKETEIGPIPEDWEAATLGEVARNEKFAVVDGPFGSQLKVSEFVDSGIPVIEMLHIKDDQFSGQIRRFITEEKFESVRRSAVRGGDLIVSKTGTLGLVALLPEDLETGIITSRLAKISPDTARIDPLYAYFALLHVRSVGYWERLGEGSTMKVLNLRKIRDAPIPLPRFPNSAASPTFSAPSSVPSKRRTSLSPPAGN